MNTVLHASIVKVMVCVFEVRVSFGLQAADSGSGSAPLRRRHQRHCTQCTQREDLLHSLRLLQVLTQLTRFSVKKF